MYLYLYFKYNEKIVFVFVFCNLKSICICIQILSNVIDPKSDVHCTAYMYKYTVLGPYQHCGFLSRWMLIRCTFDCCCIQVT